MTNRYRQIAMLLYGSVLLACCLYILVFIATPRSLTPPAARPETAGNLAQGNPTPPPEVNIARPRSYFPPAITLGLNLLIGATLIGTEWFVDYRAPSKRKTLAHLTFRTALVLLTIFLNGIPFTVYLVYPLLLFSAFVLGRNYAYPLALVSILFVTWHNSTFSRREFFNLTDLSNLMFFVLGAILVLMLGEILRQERKTSERLQKANDELERSAEQLRDYSAKVATLAAADERNRLARDIHDSLGHHLMATSIQLEKAEAFRAIDAEKSADALNYARHTIQEALQEVRGSVHALRETDSGFDLAPALTDLTKRLSNRALTPELTVEGDSAEYSTFTKMTLYRIIQEALTNVHKHAQATQATVDLRFTPQRIQLQVADNGRGIHNGSLTKNGHYGLRGIQERVALVGGDYALASDEQVGTTLSITIPNRHDEK